ncbi:MAG: hypothetical protein LBK25_00455 [Treponema sp.]|nr:hypothetical protein [Treponema sp.]
MVRYADWLSTTRTGQLAMAVAWLNMLAERAVEWNIPANIQTELAALTAAAKSALEQSQNETTRTPVATAQCRTAFAALAAKMRDIKRRYFYVPPLSEVDLVSLGLKPHDSTPSPSGKPTAQVTIGTFLAGRHELGVKIAYVTGSPADRANKGYRVWYRVVEAGETPPANPEELGKSFYTKHKKEVIEFDFGDSGKMVYFAAQVENEGKKGPWGPLVSALIP